jgi:acyl-CoA reductase-like NAD-dependent aldehyde dehydrogenase
MITQAFELLKESYTTRQLLFIKERKSQLRKLLQVVKDNENLIFNALHQDLGRSNFESYVTEVAFIKSEINLALKQLSRWSAPRLVSTPLVFQPGHSYIEPVPKGVVLIISPWNYPFQLSLVPVISAIAAGNCVILKPSELAPACAHVLEKLIRLSLDARFCQVINGDSTTAQALLDLPFNHIFYTGSTAIGREVMKKAALNLVPVTLELGGKSPVIVDDTCNLELAVKRIMWGKCLNAGQTCIAPDYVLINPKLITRFVALAKNYMHDIYNSNPKYDKNYGRIINERNCARLISYLSGGTIALGGQYDLADKFIEPTILTHLNEDALIMKEEIFGPILPLVSIRSIEDAITKINSYDNPLAMYIFSTNKVSINKIIDYTSAGGITINDCISHAGIIDLPFGGIGNSGMGSYHGQFGFDTFSHLRGVHKRANVLDNPIKYPPYTAQKLNLVRVVM